MIKTKKDYAKTSHGYAEYWNDELESAAEEFKKFWKQSEKVIDAFLDAKANEDRKGTKLNLFHSNVTTMRSMLYGRIPKVEVDRRYADQNDDTARVASEILERMLNADIEEAGEDYSAVLRGALDDRLLAGMGCARLKYDNTIIKQTQEAVYGDDDEEITPEQEIESIDEEWVDTVYVNWNDVIWSPCRSWQEMRWRAYRVYLTKDEAIERFGEKKCKNLEYKANTPGREDKSEKFNDSWERAEIWEIWDKESRCVYWHQRGKEEILDHKEDLLDLDGFFPEPPSFFANLTTSKLMPRADYVIAQDLYRSIDQLETRIDLLTEACRLVGVYDKNCEGLKRMMLEGTENDLIPVDNWAMFAEKNGLKGVVDWLPIEQVAKVIDILVAQRDNKINLLYQVTGMSDILRGAAQQSGVSATEQSLKAKFASVRVQALQDEFARFASDLQRIKAEIIGKHFQPETILKTSNIFTNTVDSQHIMPAVELIKSPSNSQWKILIRPESMAMVDYAQLKQDRTEYINALGLFLQSAAPIVEFAPSATNILLELLKWGLAGFKGSNQIEGVIDEAIEQLKNNPPKKDDGESKKQQLEMQKLQMEHQTKMSELSMKGQQSQEKHQMEMREIQFQHQQEMIKLRMEAQATQIELSAKLQEIITSAKADIERQKAEYMYEPEGEKKGNAN